MRLSYSWNFSATDENTRACAQVPVEFFLQRRDSVGISFPPPPPPRPTLADDELGWYIVFVHRRAGTSGRPELLVAIMPGRAQKGPGRPPPPLRRAGTNGRRRAGTTGRWRTDEPGRPDVDDPGRPDVDDPGRPAVEPGQPTSRAYQ